MKEFPFVVDQKNEQGMSGFIYACSSYYLNIVKILIEDHHDLIDHYDEDENTGFILACKMDRL